MYLVEGEEEWGVVLQLEEWGIPWEHLGLELWGQTLQLDNS
jgi:hypothetical protein